MPKFSIFLAKMNISVDKKIFEKFPGLHVGVLVAKGIDNSGDDKKIFELLEEVGELIRFEFTPESLTEPKLIPKKSAKHRLISVWQAAYEELGFEPVHYQTNLENMMEQIIKGNKLPKSNKLVDCYTYISLKNILPVAGYDLDLVKGDISLGFATGKERFVLARKVACPEKGEVISYDSAGVLARKWNWLDSTRAKITEKTRNAIIFVDGLPPITKSDVKKILNELKELVGMFCKGRHGQYILSVMENKIKLG